MFVLSRTVSVIIGYSGEGEKQERGGYGVALSCVISRCRGEGELTFRSRLRR